MSNRIRRPLPVRLSPRPLRAAWGRVSRSPSLRRSINAAFWPAVMGSAVIVGLALVLVTRDVFVTWDGVQPLPTGGAR